MIFERIKSEGLAHLSYFVASENEAFVVDPRRDCDVYIELAYKSDATIKYIFETHRNEDYLIGSVELAQDGNAQIYHGSGLDYKFGNVVEDDQEFTIGTLKVKALHTPGHTEYCMSYVLYDLESGENPVMVFTGDALFVGDVGRTDFGGPDKYELYSSNLYSSIFEKLLPLGDQVILCPAHGSGSVCGASISSREISTLGLERLQNPVLQLRERDTFVKYKVNEYQFYSPYFKLMEKYNVEGPPLLKTRSKPKPMLPMEFQKEIEDGALVVDTRDPAPFGGAFIKGSYNILLEGIPAFAGLVLPYDKDILLIVSDYESLELADTYFLRMGYDRIKGYLVGGIVAWYSAGLPTGSIPLYTARDLKEIIDKGEEVVVLDVRDKNELKKGYIEDSIHIHLGDLEKNLDKLPKDKPICTLCGNGTRASMAASLLRKHGFIEVYSVLGSMKAWNKAGYPVKK